MVTEVPGDSAPGKLAGLGLLPVTAMVKLAAVAVPPWSLMTCLMTLRWAAWRLLMNVQVTFSPSFRLIVTVDPLADCVPPFGVVTVHTGVPKLGVQPETAVSWTL